MHDIERSFKVCWSFRDILLRFSFIGVTLDNHLHLVVVLLCCLFLTR